MLEIIIIWSACKKLNAFAKTHGRSGIPYGIGFVIAYLSSLFVGSILGDILELPPIAGAYMVAIPSAFAIYFVLRAIVCRGTPVAESMPRPSRPSLPPPLPIPPPLAPAEPFTFACPQCGQHVSTTTEAIGTEGECPGCQGSLTVPSPNA